ncbi:MAG: excinuclease ABC subunit A [Flavobacteriales bacterium]|nr:excinuclease ABC subunit A [Flavobacteriales bacterium]
MKNQKNNWNQFSESKNIVIEGARENNLKNISVKIPRGKLVVITGLSGSGKSSLAFDTLYAEGQRRYMESFSAYARQFIGEIKRPDVESIEGLSPVIAIEQKTTSRSPRSTVGTITEIYDLLRLLYARVSDAYSYETGELMVSYTTDQIASLIIKEFNGEGVTLLSPLIKGRKGHYKELFEKLGKQGYLKVRIDGKIHEIEKGLQANRYQNHDIEVIIDRFKVEKSSLSNKRFKRSLDNALSTGNGAVILINKSEKKIRFYSQHLTCPSTGISYKLPEPNLFSFNSPYGACPSCNGLGETYTFDEDKIVPNTKISITKGAIFPLGKKKRNFIFNAIENLAEEMGENITKPFLEHSNEFIKVLMFGSKNQIIDSKIDFEGIIPYLNQLNEFNNTSENKWIKSYMRSSTCTDCNGGRLKREAFHFKINGKSIADVAALDISELQSWLNKLPDNFSETKQKIAKEILKETQKKVSFLLDVGLDYLHLNRTAKTLSGGESQRIRLATQIGSQLVGVLYILDEPSIGLHQRDNQRLIEALKKLRDNGNSVLVVEHDKEIMEQADYIIDVGPKAGRFGGAIIDQGKLSELKNSESLTYQYLSGKKEISIPKRRKISTNFISIKGASGNNLKSVNLKIPVGNFTCVTGISGSGKSTLINNTLVPLLYNKIYKSKAAPLNFESVTGLEFIDKVVEVSQSPIGRTPRSNPATYTGIFGDIRTLYAQLPQAKINGFKPGRFSFNVAGGRCEACKGAGVETIEMNFLPDVFVTCKMCHGKRYNNETLQVLFKGKSISEVLNMPISEALEFFDAQPKIKNKLSALNDVGLGYIKLGQSSTTLSGGEAQRIKLAAELSKKTTGKTIFILDEPTTGLHFEDINVLIDVLQKIVSKGNTVVVIEHNIDVIKVADYIVDLGPEGGIKGGEILIQGTPEKVIKCSKSSTAKYLKEELK